MAPATPWGCNFLQNGDATFSKNACNFFQKKLARNTLNGIADVMPTAISILIGFTVMLITLLLTSSGPNIDILKNTETDRRLHNDNITLYQGLHIQFTHTLCSEVILMLLIFFYMYLSGLSVPVSVGAVILIIEVYLTLNVLFSILRGVTNLYFSFYK